MFDLSARIGKEFGETIAIVKAAEMLGLVDTPKDDVVMTQVGWYFLAAPAPARKTLFRQAIMKLRLFQMLTARLRSGARRARRRRHRPRGARDAAALRSAVQALPDADRVGTICRARRFRSGRECRLPSRGERK